MNSTGWTTAAWRLDSLQFTPNSLSNPKAMDCFLQHFSPTPPVLWNKTFPVSCRVPHEEKMFETYSNWPLPTCDSARCVKWCFLPHGDLRIVSLFGGGKRESLGGTRKILRQPDLLPLAFPHWPFSVPVQKKQKGFGEKGSLFWSQSITNIKNLWRKTLEGYDLLDWSNLMCWFSKEYLHGSWIIVGDLHHWLHLCWIPGAETDLMKGDLYWKPGLLCGLV